jgi:two-component system alkaline phosphatase synthesis response regulator PhoP/two-component system response regulator VicR
VSRRVLAVDDEQAIVRLIEVSMSRHGYDVITASDGRQALEKAAAERPDIILMDVMMPYVDGFEAIRLLKASESTRDIPVVLLTAKRHDADMLQAIEAGARSYLTKPFAPTELVALVNKILGDAPAAE